MSLGEQVPEIRFSEKGGDAGKSSKAFLYFCSPCRKIIKQVML